MFNEVTQANVDHYNQHPLEHAVLTVALVVVAGIVGRRIVKRIVREDPSLRSGMYA